MTSLEKSATPMESADDTIALISQKLNGINRQSVEISSFTLAHPGLLPGLKVNLCFVQTSSTLIMRVNCANTGINL